MITINGDIIRIASAKVTTTEAKAALNDYEIELTDKQFQLLMLGEEIDLSVKEIVKPSVDPFATPNKTTVKKETTKAQAEVVSSDSEEESNLFNFFEDESTSTTVGGVIYDILDEGYYIMEAIVKRGRCSSKLGFSFNNSGKTVRNYSHFGPARINYLAQIVKGISPQDCGKVGGFKVLDHAIKNEDGVINLVIMTDQEGLMLKYKLMDQDTIKAIRNKTLLDF